MLAYGIPVTRPEHDINGMSSRIFMMTVYHRRRMETEAKAKVVASVWEADFVQFLAGIAVLPLSIWMTSH